jgi:hypothetical protein
MLDHRGQGLRLGIDLEAETLISNSGVDAYRIARRRADESSSHQIAKDWSRVAAAIARKTNKTKKRPAVLASMFLWFATASASRREARHHVRTKAEFFVFSPLRLGPLW